MSDYKPKPWQSPTSDGAQRVVSVRGEIVLPPDASNSDVNTLIAVSNEIVNGNSSGLDRFLANSRQQHSLNNQSYGDRHITLEGMQARWRINNGQEILNLRVHPTGELTNVATDQNIDGYMLWVHGEPDYFVSPQGINSGGPFTIFMNGYLIESNIALSAPDTHTTGYVFVFGSTALLEPSLADALKFGANTVINTKVFTPAPNKISPIPGWGNTTNPVAWDGTSLSKQPIEFGYWLFDWLSIYNPFKYIDTSNRLGYQPSGPPNYQAWDKFPLGGVFAANPVNTGGFLGDLTLTKGIYFPNSANSILHPYGDNSLAVIFSGNYFGVGLDVLCGEFYDRGRRRYLRQSWTISGRDGLAIQAGDHPNRYKTAIYQDGYALNDVYFGMDLSAKTSASKANYDATPITNAMSSISKAASSDPVVSALSPAQNKALLAWKQANVDAIDDFANYQLIGISQALLTLSNLANSVSAAHDFAYWLRGVTGINNLYFNYFTNDQLLFLPGSTTVQQPAIGPPSLTYPLTYEDHGSLTQYFSNSGPNGAAEPTGSTRTAVTEPYTYTLWVTAPAYTPTQIGQRPAGVGFGGLLTVQGVSGAGSTVGGVYFSPNQRIVGDNSTVTGTPSSGVVTTTYAPVWQTFDPIATIPPVPTQPLDIPQGSPPPIPPFSDPSDTTDVTDAGDQQPTTPPPPPPPVPSVKSFTGTIVEITQAAEAYVVTTMDAYTKAVAAYQAAVAVTPPASAIAPFPVTGDTLSKFKYKRISITNGKWSLH